MQKFIKKPIEVEACQLTHDTIAEILDWSEGHIQAGLASCLDPYTKIKVVVVTSTDNHEAVEGDWIVKGINGEFYAVPEKMFFKLYEYASCDSTESTDGVIKW